MNPTPEHDPKKSRPYVTTQPDDVTRIVNAICHLMEEVRAHRISMEEGFSYVIRAMPA